MKEVNQDSWEDDVIKSNKPTVVDFWAEWCNPCKTVSPILEEISNSLDDKANFVKVNVDKNKKLAEKYEIQSIPTIAVYKNGKIVSQKSGAQSKNSLEELIKNNI